MVDRLRGMLKARRVAVMRRAAAAFHACSVACTRLAEGPQAVRKKSLKPKAAWLDVLGALGRREVVERLFSTGLIGDELPRTQGPPDGRRILVLAAHQDDEIIGAGGTFVLARQHGAAFQMIYYTDGATRLGDAAPADVGRWRHHEARAVWRKLAGIVPVFWDYPMRRDAVAPDAGRRLADAIASFTPDTIFLPIFFEQPTEHRRLNDVLLAAHAIAPLARDIEVWGYQITTRIAGNRVVDISTVWKRKYALNRLWATQNAYRDYAYLAMGRDIANAYYLKGATQPKRQAAHTELFLVLDAPTYLEQARFYSDVGQEPRRATPPPSDETASARPRAAVAPPPDFLVIGMQKSGSYWVTALLDAHPEIRCFPSRPGHADGTGEAHVFDILARLDTDYDAFRKSMRSKLDGWFADVIPDAPPADAEARDALVQRVRQRFDEFCDSQRRRSGKRLVGEKTTETVHQPDLVSRLYPGIRTICILRDPRDRTVSFFFHQQRKQRLAGDTVVSDAHVRDYIRRVRRDYEGLLRMPPPLHVLTYEGLAADPHHEVRRLLAFLGADDTPAAVEAVVTAASFEALSGRASGDPDPGSHFRQGLTGDWSNHLTAAQAARIVDELSDLTNRVQAAFGIDLSRYQATPEPSTVSG